MDRFGIRRVIAYSAIVFGLATSAMALQDGSMLAWVGLSVVVGVSGAATSVLGYLAVLPQWFDRRLGLALGLAMCGLGAGTVILPMTAQYLVTTFGWRMAYVVLGAGSVALSLVACGLLRERFAAGNRAARVAVSAPAGVPLSTALRSYRLWAIWLVFVLSSAATLSLGPHLPSLAAIELAQQALGIPVTSTAVCTARQMLRRLCLCATAPGAGAYPGSQAGLR